ncbi:MAG: hypothetical protein ACI9SJ_001229 [Flavobacteriaceae bacterium]|jgi:hypothetical protein
MEISSEYPLLRFLILIELLVNAKTIHEHIDGNMKTCPFLYHILMLSNLYIELQVLINNKI